MSLRETYFPDLESSAYLAHAAISPINRRARVAMNDLFMACSQRGLKAWHIGGDARTRLRQKLARLIGAETKTIGLTPNTTQGMLIVAHEFPWQPGDGIVLFEGEFPGNVVPWLVAAERYDLEVTWLKHRDLEEQTPEFHACMARKPKLMAVSWVQFQSGHTLPLATLAAVREQYGVAICLDAIQGLGPLTLDVRQTPFDFIVCGGHKWLLAPEGSGFIYVKEEWMGRMQPAIAGWLSVEQGADFLFKGAGLVSYDKPMRLEASRYEYASINNVPYVGMEQSIDIYFEIGPAEMSRRIRSLREYVAAGLATLGIECLPVRADAGIVSFRPEHAVFQRIRDACDGAQVVISTPDGCIRLAPHFYNTQADLDLCLEVIAEHR